MDCNEGKASSFQSLQNKDSDKLQWITAEQLSGGRREKISPPPKLLMKKIKNDILVRLVITAVCKKNATSSLIKKLD